MSNDAYHSAAGVSKSKTDAIAPECGNSPRHYWAKYVDPNRPPFEPTASMILGTAIHAAVLEPDSFAAGYIVAPEDAPRRPTERQINAKSPSADTITAIGFWQQFAAEAAGRIIFEAEDWQNVIGARDAVLTHPDVKGLFTHGVAEESYFAIDPETGALVKCRPDYNRVGYDGIMIDLKSTADASPEEFGYSATKYRYDVQPGWYKDVTDLALGVEKAVTQFAFVAVESAPPHAVGLYYCTPEQEAHGRLMARRDLKRIIQCTEADYWPDFVGGGGAQPLKIRPYARRLAA